MHNSQKKNEKSDFAVNAARIGDKVSRKMVLDSYARKKYIDALAENTKNSSGEGVRPSKITTSINTSKDIAPER